jgi:hypothetical protein
MSIGKSRRIVIDVEDVALKRDLYAVLASEGRSLKNWFESAVNDYLSTHSPARAARLADGVAERTIGYHPSGRKREP